VNTPEARTPTGDLIDQGTPAVPVDPTLAATEAKPPVVPETYDFKAPEGYTLDPKVIETASPIFKELGLTQEQAQKLVDFQTKLTADSNKEMSSLIEKTRADWVAQVKADKDIGNKLPEVTAEIGKAKALLPADVRAAFDDAMNLTGAGDHPAFVKAFYLLAKQVNEGKPVTGAGPSPAGQTPNGAITKPTLAGAMYPNLPN
jgi:hypothetical protein